MNRIIQAAVRSQLKPIAESRSVALSDEQLGQLAHSAAMAKAFGAYGHSSRNAGPFQGRLYVNETVMLQHKS